MTCGACPSGYDDANKDGTSCADIDECKQQTFDCMLYSTCMNTAGGYDCPCDVGFHGDGKKECLANTLCNATGSNCGSKASCMDVSGTRYCVCDAFYDGDGVTCTDIDECMTDNGGCGSETYYACTNNTGAAPTCADIDVCATDNGGCGDVSALEVHQQHGRRRQTCTDIDECATNNGGCGSSALWKCTNNTGAAPTCSDVDECATNNGGCGSSTFWKCTNNTGAAPTCSDINECSTNNGNCGSATFWKCTNNTGAAPTCADINECSTNNGGCGSTANFSLHEQHRRRTDVRRRQRVQRLQHLHRLLPMRKRAPYYEAHRPVPELDATDKPSTFTVHGSGSTATVTDSNTGLEWQRSARRRATGAAPALRAPRAHGLKPSSIAQVSRSPAAAGTADRSGAGVADRLQPRGQRVGAIEPNGI